jgi:flagellar basal-body rod modification protein FlgD
MISNDLSAIPTEASQTGVASSSATSSVMGKDEFLKLLTTQLRFQDPLSPEDPKDFVAQLAQFSSLEQLVNVNDSIEALTDLQKSSNTAMQQVQALSMLGKTVMCQGDSLTVSSGVASPGGFKLAQAAEEVTVGIYDSGGNLVRTLTLGSLSGGEHTLSWDSKDNQGNLVADGTYSFLIAAKDANGQPVTVTSYIEGKVDGIEQVISTVMLRIGDRLVSLDDIISVTDES